VLLNHISQLSPVLTSNQDAILAVQAGFVGPWGEWHSSTNFGDDLEGRRDVVGGLLDAVPERIVQIRTPLHKRKLYAVDAGNVVHSDGHVAHGDFEGSGVGSSWGAYMDGYLVETSDFNSGSQSVKVTNGAARQWVSLNEGEGYVIELSGWSKRVGATGSTPWDYSVYADVALDDGSYLWGKMAKFTVSICVRKRLKLGLWTRYWTTISARVFTRKLGAASQDPVPGSTLTSKFCCCVQMF